MLHDPPAVIRHMPANILTGVSGSSSFKLEPILRHLPL